MRNRFAFPLSIPLVGLAGFATGAPGDLDPTFADGSRVRFGFGSGNDCVRATTAQLDGSVESRGEGRQVGFVTAKGSRPRHARLE